MAYPLPLGQSPAVTSDRRRLRVIHSDVVTRGGKLFAQAVLHDEQKGQTDQLPPDITVELPINDAFTLLAFKHGGYRFFVDKVNGTTGFWVNPWKNFVVILGISFHDVSTAGIDFIVQDLNPPNSAAAPLNVDSLTNSMGDTTAQAIAPGGAPTTITLGAGTLRSPAALYALFKKLLIGPGQRLNTQIIGAAIGIQGVECTSIEDALAIL